MWVFWLSLLIYLPSSFLLSLFTFLLSLLFMPFPSLYAFPRLKTLAPTLFIPADGQTVCWPPPSLMKFSYISAPMLCKWALSEPPVTQGCPASLTREYLVSRQPEGSILSSEKTLSITGPESPQKLRRRVWKNLNQTLQVGSNFSGDKWFFKNKKNKWAKEVITSQSPTSE